MYDNSKMFYVVLINTVQMPAKFFLHAIYALKYVFFPFVSNVSYKGLFWATSTYDASHPFGNKKKYLFDMI